MLDSFEEDKRSDEMAAMLATNECRQTRFMLLVRMITPIIADIRGEIYARETSGQRTQDEVRRFDQYLNHALAAYAAQLGDDMNRETRTRYPCEGNHTAIGAGPPLECPP
ncbi:MAG: hypothetical protein EPN40_06815 [Rhodanobacteraceae bacterium]|nr:MAG: hypothetical protein EPN40_06815 [Rhodanobacteraceae bacterium]